MTRSRSRSTRWRALCALPALALAAAPATAAACHLDRLAVTPLDGPHGARWHGTRAGVEVLFHNEVTDRPVTLFPEPPMTVRLAAGQRECRVDDGGVWARDGVWLSADGRTLVTSESSGSSQDLVFRDTGTCAKVGTVDLAGGSWRAADGVLLLLVPDASNVRIPLDASCRPAADTPRRP